MSTFHVCVSLVSTEAGGVFSLAPELKGASVGSVPHPRLEIVSFAPLKDTSMEDIITKVRSVAAGIKSQFFALNFGPLRAESNRVLAPVANSSAGAASKLRQMLFEALRFPNTSTVSASPLLVYQGSAANKLGAHGPFSMQFDALEVSACYGDLKWDAFVSVGRSPLNSDWFFRSALFINGRWQGPSNHKYIPVYNPATRKAFTHIAGAVSEDVDRAVNAAHEAFHSWGSTSAEYRAGLLNKIADEIEKNKEYLGKLEVVDNGKVLKEAVMDVGDAASCFRYYANELLRFQKEENGKAVDVGDATFSARVEYEPVGVCGLIIPWNYPLLMAAWKVAPCLAAGCTAVLKPSELTPLTALELAAIVHRVGVPAGVLNVITGYGPDAGSPLSNHPLVEKLAFTGSVPTGSSVMLAAAKSVKNVSLELGGKSPIIVTKCADIEQAVDWIMVGIFFNQGQVCSATSRLLVHNAIREKLLARLREETMKIDLGDGLAEGSQMGPLVSEGQYNKVLGFIRGAVNQGARVVCGGGPVTNTDKLPGYFIQPTILADVKPNMNVWREEIFGPVLSVMGFSSDEEAIKLANDSQYGLAAAVIAGTRDAAEKIGRRLRTGILWINCSQPTFVQLPWGGIKQSGVGRELGPWGLLNYLEPKQVCAWVDPNSKGWGWFKKSNL